MSVLWSIGGAHCFVCDGYRPDGYFHFNWGWSGMSDGYFLLSMLKPTNLGTGAGNGDYTNNQGALLGIKPSDGTDSPRKYTFCIDELTQAYPGSGTYFNILGSFVNRSPYTVTGQFVYQIYNADGTQKVTSVTVDAQVPRNWGIDIVTGMTRSATQMQGRISGLADGTYRLYPAVLVDGVEYPFQSPATIAGYVLITSSNGKITTVTRMRQSRLCFSMQICQYVHIQMKIIPLTSPLKARTLNLFPHGSMTRVLQLSRENTSSV